MMRELTELYGFRFASPELLLVLLCIPLWVWLRGRIGPVASVQYSSTKLLEAAVHRRPQFRPSGLLIFMRYGAMTLLIIALARPQLEIPFQERQAHAINVVFNLDLSASMGTKDFLHGQQRISRADGVKAVIGDFLQERANDRVGLVRFAEAARSISPLTLDHGWLLSQLVAEEVGGESRALGAGFLLAGEAALAGAGPSKVVITVTDAGAIAKDPSAEEVAQTLAPLGVRSHVVHITDLRNPRQQAASATLLAKVASLTGGQYLQVSDLAGLRRAHARIDERERSPQTEHIGKMYQEIMGWFVAAAGLILFAELLFAHLVWRRLP